jgi:hypothetical protein
MQRRPRRQRRHGTDIVDRGRPSQEQKANKMIFTFSFNVIFGYLHVTRELPGGKRICPRIQGRFVRVDGEFARLSRRLLSP